MQFDFKSYHVRAINAADEAEKKAINQELKDFYASLDEEEKKVFNVELQRYLLQEVGRLGSDYEAIKHSNA
ncbi:hypothetical protein VR479_10355 [Aquirufa aurantiipilula]|uniref:hypothetical protein n=1 Tax=Aquirufa aurantiipilula TaxID=2696561 RepID=UPI001CAA60EB|nr:hypothetical protein [Aquirufa aurantiipilula]MBZ1327125.1 hypothetical protein [Aquirufa aurantiipilula]